jgi:AraC-like DNA-binding protein
MAAGFLEPDYVWPYMQILHLYCSNFKRSSDDGCEPNESISEWARQMVAVDPAAAALLHVAHAIDANRSGQARKVLLACGKALTLTEAHGLLNISRDILFLARQAHFSLGNSAAESSVHRQVIPLAILPLMTSDQAEQYLQIHHPQYSPRCDGSSDVAAPSISASSEPSKLIRKALSEIGRLRGPELKVVNVVELCGVSRRTLEIAFREELSRSIGEVLRERGLMLAAHLASTSALSVKELAQAAGYLSPTSFTRDFKEKYGKAPSVWRRM